MFPMAMGGVRRSLANNFWIGEVVRPVALGRVLVQLGIEIAIRQYRQSDPGP